MLKKFIKWLILPLVLVFVGVNLLIFGLLVANQQSPISHSMFMLSHRMSGGQVHQAWVDYQDIAKSVKQAAIASEDGNFVRHHGFDFQSMKSAARVNEDQGKISLGGSTISQQLAKNLFLTSHRSYVRKGEEAVIVLMMERVWSKQRILEVYLNVVEFGDGIYGIESAARHYFGKSASKLTAQESALLISMLPNPKYYQHNMNAKRLRTKQRIILARMKQATLPHDRTKTD